MNHILIFSRFNIFEAFLMGLETLKNYVTLRIEVQNNSYIHFKFTSIMKQTK
jgi:hypothetical protein